MKRLSIAMTVLAVLILVPSPRADEGMWTFDNPPLKIWKEKYGFEATPQWLEHVRLATVRLNDGGTSSFVSPDGLLFTNQHVAAGQLQKLSTGDKDLTRDGFYAPTRADELKCPDLEANVLVSLEEVTARVQGAAKGAATSSAAAERRKAEMAAIEKESAEKTGLKGEIVTLYNGGEYWLYRYKTYTDLRIVFAPEEETAFFGGDHDNFTYPRYDLDISFLRAYENGRPASTPNYFRWSAGGAGEKELVFVPGNPGSTARLLTLAQIAYQRDVGNPLQMRVWTARRDALARYAKTGAEAARRAGSASRSLENSIKRLVGQQEGLDNPRIMGRKEAEEKALRRSVASRPEWLRLYGTAWSDIAGAYRLYPPYARRIAFSTLAPSRLGSIASSLVRYAEEVAKPNDRRYDEFRDSRLDSFKAGLLSPAPIYADMEEAILAGWLAEAQQALGDTDPFVRAALGGKSAAAVAREVVGATRLGEAAARKALIDGGPAAIAASEDPFIVLARRVEPIVRQLRAWQERTITSVETAAGERIAKARFAVYGRTIPPDANFTLRIEYGTVLGYEEDTTRVPYKTTLAGLFDRSASFDDQPPFHLPRRWKERRAALDLSTPLNFVYTADTIGGNSGSPVINRKAEVVGINFDSNLQKLANRYLYIPEEEGSRAVGVHSAAVLEALGKVYDASPLVAELTGKPVAPKPAATPEQVIGQVQARLAPDTRVAVFSVKAERKGEALELTGDVGRPEAKRAVNDALAGAGYRQVTDRIQVLPDPAIGETPAGIIKVSVAHIRGRPAHAAEQVTEWLMGETVTLLKRDGGWYYAQHEPDGYLGWVQAGQIVATDAAGLAAWKTAPKLIVTSATLVMRDRPASEAAQVTDLVVGNLVQAAGPAQKKWAMVATPDGRKGFVERSAVEDQARWQQSRVATPDSIAATASLFVGLPYLWGGTSSKGFDCSGLVRTVYGLNGVSLPRDADQQGLQGDLVSLDRDFADLRRGDLLFYGSPATSDRPERVTHVMIYLGNKDYIDASSGVGIVAVNSLDPKSPRYRESILRGLVKARRVLPVR